VDTDVFFTVGKTGPERITAITALSFVFYQRWIGLKLSNGMTHKFMMDYTVLCASQRPEIMQFIIVHRHFLGGCSLYTITSGHVRHHID